MSILKNAIASIQIGIEDYERIEQDPRRIQSSIRNIYSGILLLFKYKLQQLSPKNSDEVLLKAKITPYINAKTKHIQWKGTGKKTVDVQEIKERLKALDFSINEDYLNTLQQIRNDIEHYYIQKNESQIKEAITKAFHLIINFCPYIKKQPIELLGQECWDVMLDISNIYQQERKECLDSLKTIAWKYSEVENAIDELRCPKCDSELIKVIDNLTIEDPDFLCRTCGNESNYIEVIGSSIANILYGNSWHNISKGGECVTCDCPKCGYDSFSFAEKTCLACHSKLEYTQCAFCENELSPDEQELDGLCSYCFHKKEKWYRE